MKRYALISALAAALLAGCTDHTETAQPTRRINHDMANTCLDLATMPRETAIANAAKRYGITTQEADTKLGTNFCAKWRPTPIQSELIQRQANG